MATMKEETEIMFIKSLTPKEDKEFVKSASFLDKENYARSPETTYLMGCHAIIHDDKESLKEISKVASIYNIEGKLDKFACNLREYAESKNEENYALTINGQNMFPLHNSELIKRSDLNFKDSYMTFPYEIREKIATKIFNKAAENKLTELSSPTLLYSRNYSNKGIDKSAAGMNIGIRSTLIGDQDGKKEYMALAKMLTKSSEISHFLKIASMVEKLDRKYNLYPYHRETGRYGTSVDLKPPIEEIFILEKNASKEIDILGKKYSLSKLASVPVDTYLRALGGEITKSLLKDGALSEERISTILPTLPRSDKAILDKYLSRE